MENGFSSVPKEKEEEGEDHRNEKSTEQMSYLSTKMIKKVSYMAAPMVAVAISQYLLQVIAMVMAGHLDELSLSSVAIATCLTNVTGFSLLVRSSSSSSSSSLSFSDFGWLVWIGSLATLSLHYVLVNAIGAAASTHVSNELGAGKPKAARAAAISALSLAAIDATIVSLTLYSFRRNWSNIFSNESEVVHYGTQMTPILCLSIVADSFLAVLSGVARGTGWQHIGAYANIGSFYMAGIPVGSILCFVVKLRGKGLWIGIFIGSSLQVIILALVTFFTNWEQEATKARDRVIEMTPQSNQVTESIEKDDVEALVEDISENV
ncbi:hypothetical protein AALP_AA5G099800 [Arabis alpina]|uniref:Uncharacterized protein n=1 Tax=Arabis alpina TaxID=50452 RepID=A0A087GW29_ARAAL|nr:hypothetical protein AALP_AA5G099800 [Arabis alpina]